MSNLSGNLTDVLLQLMIDSMQRGEVASEDDRRKYPRHKDQNGMEKARQGPEGYMKAAGGPLGESGQHFLEGLAAFGKTNQVSIGGAEEPQETESTVETSAVLYLLAHPFKRALPFAPKIGLSHYGEAFLG